MISALEDEKGRKEEFVDILLHIPSSPSVKDDDK
jgi:hypothetical protein